MEKLIAKLVETVIKKSSAEFRNKVKDFVGELEVTAKKTKSPWDDIFVMLLKVLLDIE